MLFMPVYSSESLSAVEEIIERKKARILVHTTKNTSLRRAKKLNEQKVFSVLMPNFFFD